MKQERDERLKLVAELEQDASASAMKAYFFIALVRAAAAVQGHQGTGRRDTRRPSAGSLPEVPDARVSADVFGRGRARSHRPGNRFRRSALADWSTGGHGREPRGCVSRAHACARAIARQRLDFVRAGEVMFSYARYADALALYDRILSSPAAAGLEPQVKLGRAKSLSYLKRHDEAIAQLIEVLQNDPATILERGTTGARGISCRSAAPSSPMTMRRPGSTRCGTTRSIGSRGWRRSALNRLDEVAEVLRRGAEHESRRLRLRTLPWPARFGRAQLEAGNGTVYTPRRPATKRRSFGCRPSSPNTRRTSPACRTDSSPPNASRSERRPPCATNPC